MEPRGRRILRGSIVLVIAFAAGFPVGHAGAQESDAAVVAPSSSTLELEAKQLDLSRREEKLERERVKFERERSAPQVTLLDLIGTLTAWVALMLLLSIGVERIVSLTKRGEALTRKRTLRAYFGEKIYEQLVDPAVDAKKLARMYDLIGSTDTPPKTAAENLDAGQLYAELVRLDRRLDDGERQRGHNLRTLALGIGTALAWALGIDTLALLRPVLPNVLAGPNNTIHAFAGIVLSGFAAAAGSAFWNDILDKLTNWKKKAKEAGVGDG